MTTVLKTEKEKKEFFDTEEEIDRKAEILAEMITKSKHFTVFTGAGISTSAGVPDFRSGMNTVLPTGPGAWERRAAGYDKVLPFEKTTLTAIPTPSHMALVKLQEVGLLKFLISQNTDGLHKRSGFPPDHLAEIHGNSNLEICKNEKCGKRYFRDFRVRNNKKVHEHETGRHCEDCGEALYDSIINFGEYLPVKEYNDSFEHAEKSDLCLVLGSSLRVETAANMPYATATGIGKLVIVNLQATPLDKYADLRVNSFIDDLMIKVMAKLNLEIPPFILKRRVMVMKTDKNKFEKEKDGKVGILVRGVDQTGAPYDLLPGARIKFIDTQEVIMIERKEPLVFYPEKSELETGAIRLQMAFRGHYGDRKSVV